MKDFDDFSDDFGDDELEALSTQKAPLADRLLKYGGIGAGCLVVGLGVFFAGYGSGSSANTSTANQVVGVQSQAPLLESLDSLRESRIESLIEQINQSRAKEGGADVGQLKQLLASQAENQEVIDELLGRVMEIGPGADQATLDVAADSLLSIASPTDGDKVASSVVAQPRISDQLGTAGKRASASSLSLLSVSNGGPVYLAATPFATETGIYHQVSLVKVVGQKVVDYRYVGYFESEPDGLLEQAVSELVS